MSYDDILDDMFKSLPSESTLAFVKFYSKLQTINTIQGPGKIDFVRRAEKFIEIYELDFVREYTIEKYSLSSLAENHFYAYKAELDDINLTIQIKLSKENSMSVFDTVKIDEKRKKDIRELVNKVKEKIDKSSIDQDKKDSLHKKLDHFLYELDQSKTRLAAFTSSLIQLASATGEAAKELEPIVKIFERITKAIGLGSKEQAQLTWEEQKKIEHQPTTEDEETKK